MRGLSTRSRDPSMKCAARRWLRYKRPYLPASVRLALASLKLARRLWSKSSRSLSLGGTASPDRLDVAVDARGHRAVVVSDPTYVAHTASRGANGVIDPLARRLLAPRVERRLHDCARSEERRVGKGLKTRGRND